MTGIWGSIVLALTAIARAKVRASLTVLGILIGVAAVVIVTALGTGVERRIRSQIESLGSNVIFVYPQSNQRSGARGARGSGGRLTEADGRAIARDATSVAAVVPFLQAQAQVVAGDRNVLTNVVASSRRYLEVRGFSLADGANFTEGDEHVKAKVCLLGSTVKENLFGSEDAVGQIVRVGRYPFRVLGVLARKGQLPGGEDQDDRLVMPAGTFRSRILPTAPGRVHTLLVSASDRLTVGRASAQIESILRQRHRIAPEDEPDFGVRTQAEFLKTQEQIFDTLKALLVGIAMVALGVGGIGVMNIMLVSVTERTREIGIRMAIGAREGDVRLQFLVEAITLCMLGGILGTALGLGAIYALSRTLGWSMFLPPEALLVALCTSFGTGVLFGFWPAERAAHLDPIEALRHE
ncbi:MAG TPA: ABC transporter permease [Polyangiaceae bacterium]|jgi:putative ABC transport system permease protein